MSIPVLVITLAVGVIPVVAILSNLYLKSLEIKSKGDRSLEAQDKQLIDQLMAENQQMKKRLENLEAIVVDADLNMLNGMKDREAWDRSDSSQRYKDSDLEQL